MEFWIIFQEMNLLAKILVVFFILVFIFLAVDKPLQIFYHKYFTKPESVRAELRIVKKVMPLISEDNKTPDVRRPGDTYLIGFRTDDRRNKFFEVSWQIADTLEENTVGTLTFHWKSFVSFTDVEKLVFEDGVEYHHEFFRSMEELEP